MRRTGIVLDRRYLDHRTVKGHPENHRRLEAIYSLFDEPDMNGLYIPIVPEPAGRDSLTLIHTAEHVKRIEQTACHELCMLTPDTSASSGSFTAALLAVGGLIQAASLVASGTIDNAMVLVRPPGHHAERNRAMGFCLFNTTAITAAFARTVLGLDRVLIVDWDVHHGNGIQHAFETDPSVFYFSVHQYPLFPGTGLFTEAGHGKGEGYTMNLPLPKGYGDEEYAALFEILLKPVAMEFKPDLIVVSAGFDTHFADPLGGMRMTPQGYGALTRTLMDIADACCKGRMILTLEGGYHLDGLKESVRAVLMELKDLTRSQPAKSAEEADPRKVEYAISRCVHVHRPFWKSLGSL